MDYGIINVRTDVNACNCAWGCMHTVRESALKVDSGRKIPCHARESNQQHNRLNAPPTELHQDFSHGVCHVTMVTIARRNPDMELETQPSLCFSPDMLSGANHLHVISCTHPSW